MKKLVAILFIASMCFFCSCLIQREGRQALYDLQQQSGDFYRIDSVLILPEYEKTEGNADSGYLYLVRGDMFNSGIPYPLYQFLFETGNRRLISLAGYNQYEVSDFAIFKKGEILAAPGCLHCHGQVFDEKLVVGLGNSYSKYQVNYTKYLKPGKLVLQTLYGKDSREWKNFENLFTTGLAVAPHVVLQMQGPNPAHRIGNILSSHRDPLTLQFRSDTSYFPVPSAVVPTDIPALWLAKKKNAWTSVAFAQGNPPKQFMHGSLLTMKDTAEAAAIYEMMKDIWAYLQTLQPPEYPHSVNKELADEGRLIFNSNCSGCHGTYGKEGVYLTRLIPEWMVGTDSLLLKYYCLYKGHEEWFNKSWFATTHQPAFAGPQYGYVAQPLDGIWITAPYFHNGSVPTLEGVLNSKLRPRYWKRNFDRQEYNYENPGWKYKTRRKPGGKKTYNTDIPGYGNYGHYFGDRLTNSERKAVIEYLKTL